jgi:hypothetical protein
MELESRGEREGTVDKIKGQLCIIHAVAQTKKALSRRSTTEISGEPERNSNFLS